MRRLRRDWRTPSEHDIVLRAESDEQSTRYGRKKMNVRTGEDFGGNAGKSGLCYAALRMLMCAFGVLALLGGCAARMTPTADDVLIFATGAGGNHGYSDMMRGLRAGNVENIQVFNWGTPVFVFNLQDPGVHRRAEAALAAK